MDRDEAVNLQEEQHSSDTKKNEKPTEAEIIIEELQAFNKALVQGFSVVKKI